MGALFQTVTTKPKFHVDAYGVTLAKDRPAYLVKQAAYWYSMWSHRRDGTWKGYVQMNLAPDDDDATALLANLMNRAANP